MINLTQNQAKALVESSISEFKNSELKQRVKFNLLEPYPISLRHEWNGQEQLYTAWVICRIPSTGPRSGVIVYACGGFADSGLPWGVVDTVQLDSGPSSCWYDTFEKCVIDTGWFDE